jgi:hypothetical protein
MLLDTKQFLEAFAQFLNRTGRSPKATPWTYVEKWEDLVKQIEEGYGFDYDEYSNDAYCRKVLAEAFLDPMMCSFKPQMDAVRERVRTADSKLKSLFISNFYLGSEGRPWWLRGVFKYGGSEYSEDIKNRLGIEVPIVD